MRGRAAAPLPPLQRPCRARGRAPAPLPSCRSPQREKETAARAPRRRDCSWARRSIFTSSPSIYPCDVHCGVRSLELHSARSSFEQARFNLVTALSNIEAKKRFEFLEAVSGTMDAHLRYFKQGYELLHQMEPFINQVLAYAQQSRERSNYEIVKLERAKDKAENIFPFSRDAFLQSGWQSDSTIMVQYFSPMQPQ